jgi:hypothetical protein
MPQDTRLGGAKKSPPPLSEIAGIANRRIKELGGLQSDFLGRIQKANQGWYSFMQAGIFPHGQACGGSFDSGSCDCLAGLGKPQHAAER